MINLKITLIKHQCGFIKGFSTQHRLLAMIEKIRNSLESWRGELQLVFLQTSAKLLIVSHMPN